MIQNVGEAMNLLRVSITVLNSTIIQESNGVKNVTSHVLQNLSKRIVDANSSVETSINTLTDRLARGIQTLYMFDSCRVILKFSILLPSGMYRIRSGNTSINMYCSTTTFFVTAPVRTSTLPVSRRSGRCAGTYSLRA